MAELEAHFWDTTRQLLHDQYKSKIVKQWVAQIHK